VGLREKTWTETLLPEKKPRKKQPSRSAHIAKTRLYNQAKNERGETVKQARTGTKTGPKSKTGKAR